MSNYYSLSVLKEVALDSANVMGLSVTYSYNDAEKAYIFAVQKCRFENPISSDVDYLMKQYWLLEGMRLYFLRDALQRNALRFDLDGLKLGQPSRILRDMVFESEAAFSKAKGDPAIAHLFIDASGYFGKLVEKPGILDDAIGQSVNPDEVE